MKRFKIAITAVFCGLSFSLIAAEAPSLTPANEPTADSFYICYQKKCKNTQVRAPLYRYYRYKYIGCSISQLPCHLHQADKFNARSKPLKQFQWANNYPEALNAFYRCAYS